MDLTPTLHTERHRSIGRLYDLAHLVVDFLAAALFVIGSVMFFYEAWQVPGTWCFLIGSIFFGVKPSLKLARAMHLTRLPLPDEAGAVEAEAAGR
ncbi:MAG: YrhK family protein [Pseudomonadota bacterium]